MKQQHKIVIQQLKIEGYYMVSLYKKVFIFWKKIDSWIDAVPFSHKTHKLTILYKIPDERVIFKFTPEHKLFI